MLVVACFSRHLAALVWAQEQLQKRFGPLALASPDFPFEQTEYYAGTMGTDLKKRFLAFRDLVAADSLPVTKLWTIALERELAESKEFLEERPVNLDPGHLQLGKFLLATTKDQAHRIYLRDGIYAEVTLRFHEGSYQVWPWTYRDYQEDHVRGFFARARDFYRAQLQGRR